MVQRFFVVVLFYSSKNDYDAVVRKFDETKNILRTEPQCWGLKFGQKKLLLK
jgi:hypothetical protein